MSAKFAETFCSQCGGAFGPGDSGYSHCEHHSRRTPDGRKIVTSHDRPPVPTTAFDWSAVTEDYDGAPDAGFQPVGRGPTEALAIADLLNEIEEHVALLTDRSAT